MARAAGTRGKAQRLGARYGPVEVDGRVYRSLNAAGRAEFPRAGKHGQEAWLRLFSKHGRRVRFLRAGPAGLSFPDPAAAVRVGVKGQIVIPEAIRAQLGITPGDVLIFHSRDGEVLVMTPERYVQSLAGIAGGIYGKTREEVDAYIRSERESWSE